MRSADAVYCLMVGRLFSDVLEAIGNMYYCGDVGLFTSRQHGTQRDKIQLSVTSNILFSLEIIEKITETQIGILFFAGFKNLLVLVPVVART